MSHVAPNDIVPNRKKGRGILHRVAEDRCTERQMTFALNDIVSSREKGREINYAPNSRRPLYRMS